MIHLPPARCAALSASAKTVLRPTGATQALASGRIGLEVMDLNAACRTYNILVSEDRRVTAALLFE